MEILDRLPDELRWNVQKYLKHPTAEIVLDELSNVALWIATFGKCFISDDGYINYHPEATSDVLRKIYVGQADFFLQIFQNVLNCVQNYY